MGEGARSMGVPRVLLAVLASALIASLGTAGRLETRKLKSQTALRSTGAVLEPSHIDVWSPWPRACPIPCSTHSHVGGMHNGFG